VIVQAAEQRIADHLDAFERAHDTQDLKAALNIIETEVPAADAGHDQRLSAVRQWLRLLTALDRQGDPAWDADDVPQVSITPRPSGGVTYPSGIRPADIPDPAVRAEYEQALREAADKAERYRFQLELRRIDERAMAGLARFLAGAYSGPEASRDELGPVLAGASYGDRQRARLRAAMERADQLRGEES
jgi:hypothetical protein